MKTKERILQASLQLFGEKGYERTTTKEISLVAGIHESTLFRHFPSKQHLLLEALVVYSIDDGGSLEESGHLADDLSRMAKRFINQGLEHIQLYRISLMEAPVNDEVARIISRYIKIREERFVAYLERQHAKGTIKAADFTTLASVFYSTFYAFLSSHIKFSRLDLHDVDRDRLVNEMVELFVARLQQ